MEALAAILSSLGGLGLSPGVVLCLVLLMLVGWAYVKKSTDMEARVVALTERHDKAIKESADREDATRKEASEQVQAALELVEKAQSQTRETLRDWSTSNKEQSEQIKVVGDMLTDVMAGLQTLASKLKV